VALRERRGSYAHLLVVLTLYLLLYPLVHAHDRHLLELVSLVVVLDAVYAVSFETRRWYLPVGAGLLVAASDVVFTLSDSLWTAFVRNSLNSLFVAYVIALIVRSMLRRRGPVTRDTIMGAICVYLLMGWAWSFMYRTVMLLDPGALTFPEASAERGTDLLYFSFVTLTTLGYGDVLPVSVAARSLAWLEAVAGQLFVAVTIAHLVGMRISAAARPDGTDP
jgi:hypothetical protein